MLLLGSAAAEFNPNAKWNYELNGKRWAELKSVGNNECGGDNQSPIDLTFDIPEENRLTSEEDSFNKVYANQKNVEVKWDKMTSIVNFNRNDGYFSSWFAWDNLKMHSEFQPL